MADDNRNFGRRGGGNRGGGQRRHHRHSGGRDSRGRPQRPLLTTAFNGTALSLVALVIVDNAWLEELLGYAIVVFALSAVVSYIAQRTSPKWIEKISDAFFFIGLVLLVVVGVSLSGIFLVV